MPKESDFNKLFDKNPKIKYGMAKQFLIMADENPSKLYPFLDKFISLLDNENNVIKWTSINIIGLLAKVDNNKKIDPLLTKFFKQLNCGKMITVNHTILCLMHIAIAKPEYKNKITKELLKIKNYEYDTDECKNIIYGKMIEAFDKYILKIDPNVKAFVEEQINNTRNPVKKKAEKFLRKWNKTKLL